MKKSSTIRQIILDFFVMRFSAFVHRQICEWGFCSDEGFMRKLCTEAEAGDEAVEAVSVEKVGGDREVLLGVCPLFLGERSVQFGLEVVLLLCELLYPAARSDGALAG